MHFVKLVPKQLPKGVSEESLEEMAHSQSILFLAVILVLLGFAFWLNGEMVYFWTFLSMLQIVVYMPIIRVNLPPNAEIFLESMRHVAEFELFDSHAFINFFSKLVGLPEHDDKNPNAEEYKGAGFTSLEFHENMGYIFLMITFLALALLTIAILSIWKPKAKKILKKIEKKWVWSYTIRFISVCYIFTVIAYALASLENGTAFKVIGGITIGLYPLWTVVFLFRNRASLASKEFLEKYWSLYGTLKFKETTGLLYPMVSCIRKGLYVFGAIYLKQWSYF